jgi:hypothetical protein
MVQWAKYTDTVIDRPVKEVWPVFRDLEGWYREYSLEVLYGPPYEAESGLLEGQVLKATSSHSFPRMAGLQDSKGPEYFITKIMRVVSEKEIVSVLAGSAYDWEEYTSFYIWRLSELQGATTITVDGVGGAKLSRPLSEVEFTAYNAALVENWHRSWSTAFESLKKVMEVGREPTKQG